MKKILISALIILATSNCFAALKTTMVIDGHTYEHFVVLKANYDRTMNRVIAQIGVYKDAAYYQANKNNPRKIIPKILPFSYFPAQNLLNVLDLTETALLTSELDKNLIETNIFNGAEIVSD